MRTTIRTMLCAAVVGGALIGEAVQEFAFTPADYSTGEELTNAKGVTGATWQLPLPAGATATNIVVGTRKAMDFNLPLDGSAVLKSTDELPVAATRCIDFTIVQNRLSPKVDYVPDVAGAMSPARFEDGSVGFSCWGDGEWHSLHTDVVTNTTVECRIELKTVGDKRYVSYLVKNGDEWQRLVSDLGRDWFVTRPELVRTEVGVEGSGCMAGIGVSSEPAQTGATFYWIGGTSGDWSNANNWSLSQGGTVASRAPGIAGDVAFVDGAVTLTVGSETATATDLVVTYSADGKGDAIGGTIDGEVSLDTSRPLAGKQLAATIPTLFGRCDYEFYWTRGSWQKDYVRYADGRTLTPGVDDYEHWFRLVASRKSTPVFSKEFYFSRLPVCYMTTDDGEMPSTKKEEHTGTIVLQGGEKYKAIQFDKKTVGKMTVKLRGNSTLSYPKKAFKLKLDKKTDMFGFGKQKHWVLLANYNDMANQRNKLAYDLSKDIGMLAMDTTWVVNILNGEYLGLYQFGEHIRPDDNRVPIGNWEDVAEAEGGTAEDLSVIDTAKYDISTDYLFEFSSEMDEVTCFTTKSGKLAMKTMVNSPEYLKTNPVMLKWVQDFMQEYWDACTSADLRSKTGRSYRDYSDADSMALFTLVNEIFTNHDGCKKSRYAYIKNGKLIWGPTWDFDYGAWSIRVGDETKMWTTIGESATEKEFQFTTAQTQSMMKEWFSDPAFCRNLHRLYWKHRARIGQMVEDVEGGCLMDKNEAYICEAAASDDARWLADRKKDSKFTRTTSAADTAYLKEKLRGRLQWLDSQFASPQTLMESVLKSCEKAKKDYKLDLQSNPRTYSEPPSQFLLQ